MVEPEEHVKKLSIIWKRKKKRGKKGEVK